MYSECFDHLQVKIFKPLGFMTAIAFEAHVPIKRLRDFYVNQEHIY